MNNSPLFITLVAIATLGIGALAIVRGSRAESTIKPTTEALIGWLFFGLLGLGAWALGGLGWVTMPWLRTPLRIAVILGVLFASKRIWSVRPGVDLWGFTSFILMALGVSILYRARVVDSQLVLLGGMTLIASRLVQGREWALLQARDRERTMRRMSHALRTPAAAIHALADALSAGAVEDPRERARFIALIQAEAARLGLGLDRMLRIARGSETLELSPVPLDLGAWREAVAERWRATMPGLELAGVDHVVATVDPERLDEAVDALLDNAMRYGGKRVVLGVSRAADGVEISVEDDGGGVPDELRRRLAAHPDEPVDPAIARGFGLGLWAAAQVARAHGGRLEIAGTSRFVLSLPVSA